MTQIVAGSKRIQNKMVHMLADGNSQQVIADKIGVERKTINRWANREDIRRKVEEQAARLVECLPEAVDLSRKVISAGNKEADRLGVEGKEPDKSVIDMALKEGNRIQQSVGIAPSHTPSIVIGAIYNDNSQNVVLPQVQGLLDRLNAIDVTNPPALDNGDPDGP
jgi:hypothetical protein